MATDDERRDVARRLRELEQGVIGALIPTGELAEDVLRAIDYGRSGAMTPYGCLADLIEPDTTTDTTKNAQDTTKCDRDALLSLADEMEYDADVENAAKYDPMLGSIARMQVKYANRIREALGEGA